MLPNCRQQHRLGVARRVHQLDVVARVEPPAGDVVRPAQERRVAVERVVPVHRRAGDRRVRVVSVGGLPVEHASITFGPSRWDW